MTADCAPVVLVGDTAVGVVHAGWRGLVAGVIEATAAGLAALGATPVATLLGPCIDPSSYEFGPEDLDRVEAALGPTVRSVTAWGTPALDVPAAVAAACERTGWPIPATPPSSTADERWYSHRLRPSPNGWPPWPGWRRFGERRSDGGVGDCGGGAGVATDRDRGGMP